MRILSDACALPTGNHTFLIDIVICHLLNSIQIIFSYLDDIDLFTGAMAEKPVIGGSVGPTFACIIGQQFTNLRHGTC